MSGSEYPAGRLRTSSGRKAIVPLWVLEADILTDGEFMVYTALIAHADQDGGCFPQARRLSEITHKAVGTCRNAVQKLRRLGLIETWPQYRDDGGQTGNLYAIAEVPPPEIAAKVDRYRAEVKARRNQTPPLHHTVQPPYTTQCRGATPHGVANNNPREQPKGTGKTNTSSPSGDELTAVPRARRPSAAPPRARKTSPTPAASPNALGLLAQLPRPWRDGEPWVRRRLAAALDKALDTYGPPALLAAILRYAPDPAAVVDDQPNPGQTRQLVALRRVVALLGKDVKAGTCAACGEEHPDRACGERNEPSGWSLTPGVCVMCDAPDAPARDLPLAGAAYACDDCWAQATTPGLVPAGAP